MTPVQLPTAFNYSDIKQFIAKDMAIPKTEVDVIWRNNCTRSDDTTMGDYEYFHLEMLERYLDLLSKSKFNDGNLVESELLEKLWGSIRRLELELDLMEIIVHYDLDI